MKENTLLMCVAFMPSGSSELISSVYLPLRSVCSPFPPFCSLLCGYLGYRRQLQSISWRVGLRDVLDRRETGSQFDIKVRGGDLAGLCGLLRCKCYSRSMVSLSTICKCYYIRLQEYRWGTVFSPLNAFHIVFQSGTKMEFIGLLVVSLSIPHFTWSLLADDFFF